MCNSAALLPVATFFLSVAIVIIAWLQWRVAHSKLRLDLFDRRYKVYEATQKFVDSINNDPEHVDSYLNDFNAGTSNAEFLFEDDVLNYIKLVRKQAVHMRTARMLYEAEPDGEERTRNIERYEADRSWLIEQATVMTKTLPLILDFRTLRFNDIASQTRFVIECHGESAKKDMAFDILHFPFRLLQSHSVSVSPLRRNLLCSVRGRNGNDDGE